MVLSKDLKIAICFGLIIGVLISVCNLCFASEDVTVNLISGLGIDSDTGAVITSSSSVGYFNIEPGYVYHITNNLVSSPKVYGFSNDIIELSDTVVGVTTLSGRETVDITYSQYQYVYFNIFGGTSITVTRDKLNGLPDVVDNLAFSLSYNDLNNVFVLVVPILAISVLVGLGIYLVRRIINKIKKKKGGI